MKLYSSLEQVLNYVPKHEPVSRENIVALADYLLNNGKILVLTGAGVSTESGIPDYRSEGVGLFARSSTKPVQFQEFLKHPKVRQRYWARNFVGWPNFSQVQPNKNHMVLRDLEDMGKVQRVITQNVDNLHSKAGSKSVIDLHGTAFKVMCLGCEHKVCRHEFQKVLMTVNEKIAVKPQAVRPDGDIELPQEFVKDFKIPQCPKCSGILKPDIVFFGDNVPKTRVDEINAEVEHCDALLVLGSSLSTYSGYRIVVRAKELGKAIAIVNIGATRADDLADFKLSTKCSDVLLQSLEQSGLLNSKS